MTFLSFTTLLVTGAVAVPALLLLYFLKLRRQEKRISSTLLWRRAVQDLQVNAPFQRLRRNLLLFLQMVVLGALIFGLGQPVTKFLRTRERTIVMLLDRSASMKSREAGEARLAGVKRAAATFVQNMGDADRAMIIAFAERAQVICPLTSDRRELLRQIDGVEAGDGRSTLAEALQLAVAYSSRIVDVPGVTTPAPTAAAAEIELFSDGRIADADEQVVQRGQMLFVRVGEAADNVGIVGLDVRRNIEKPGDVSVFARVENFGPAAVKTDVSLSFNERVLSVREVSLGPASGSTTRPGAGGGAEETAAAKSLAFELTAPSAGVVEVRIARRDALEVDNAAYAALGTARKIRLLGVGDRAYVRQRLTVLTGSLPGAGLEWMTPSEYEKADEAELIEGGQSKYDLVIFDRHSSGRLPAGSYLFFGGVPKIEGVAVEGETGDEHIVNWDEGHPVMRYVQFDHVHVSKWQRLRLPQHAVKLVEGERSPIVAWLADGGRQFVIVAFDLFDSDFPLKVPFVLFMQNVVRTLGGSGGEASWMLRPGDTLTLPVPRGAREAAVTRPDGSRETVDVRGRLELNYGRTHEAGVYGVRFDDAEKTGVSCAVNLLDRMESRIAPSNDFRVGRERVSQSESVERTNEPLWPYAVMGALVILVVEWWVYNRRVMI